MQTGAHRIAAALAHLVATGADVNSIAEAACAVWRRVAAALSPIIGQRGVEALFDRSLHRTRTTHPELSVVQASDASLENFTALQAALSSQTSAEAAATNGALLGAFYDLLSNLIGEMLTVQLLKSALDYPSTDHAAQDDPSS